VPPQEETVKKQAAVAPPKEKPEAPAPRPEEVVKGQAPALPERENPLQSAREEKPAAAVGVERREPERWEAPPSEAENLRRWRESGQARSWVEAHKGHWNHEDWLALLAALERSPYWPMQPNAVGGALEEAKQEWLRRN
jgi:hypothetical protein